MTLTDTLDGSTRELAISGLFIAIGHDPRSELLHGQVRLDEEGYVLTEQGSSRTNLPGVFAAGDLVDHTYRQAITAAGSGCAAALDAERYLADLDDVGDPVLAQAEARPDGRRRQLVPSRRGRESPRCQSRPPHWRAASSDSARDQIRSKPWVQSPTSPTRPSTRSC